MKEMIKMSGTVYWASIVSPNQMSGKYQIDFVPDSKEMLTELKKQGIRIKNKQISNPEKYREGTDVPGYFVTLKSSFTPKVFDSKKKPVEGVLIGNGSKINVLAKPYSYNSPVGGKGVALGLQAIQIVSLKSYESDTADLFDEEDGGFSVADHVNKEPPVDTFDSGEFEVQDDDEAF